MRLFCKRWRMFASCGKRICLFLVILTCLGLVAILQFVISAPFEVTSKQYDASLWRNGVKFAGGMQGHFQLYTLKGTDSTTSPRDMDQLEKELALERDRVIASRKNISDGKRALYPGWERRLPGAIIIGVRKCGTRALLEFLRMHPDVRAPGPEPHFFDQNYHRGLHWYKSIMPMSRAEMLTIEKTPRYFIVPTVPEKVYNMSDRVKLLLVVCNPVTRLISDYSQMVTKRHLKRFEKWIVKNGSGEVDVSLQMVKTGFYVDYFNNWSRFFKKNQMFIVDGMQLIQKPWKVMEEAQRFLGLRHVLNKTNFFMDDERGFPCMMRMDRKSHHCLTRNKGRKHPYVDEQLLSKIRNLYKPYNEDFFNVTGKLFLWD